MAKVTTFLMFSGQAEEAIRFYTSIIPGSAITDIKRWGPEGPGMEGTVEFCTFHLNGHEYKAIDSAVKHSFTFTPSMSLFIECKSDKQIQDLYTQLSEGGQILMPMDTYDFSRKFTWFNCKFGVSWQLILW